MDGGKKHDKDESSEAATSEQLKSELGEKRESRVEDDSKETQFYLSEEEFNDQRLLNRLTESNEALSRLFEQEQ